MTKAERKAAEYRSKVEDIVETVHELKTESEAPIAEEAPLLDRYLHVIEQKCKEVDDQLGEVDPENSVDMALVASGIREARQRLKIAKRAVRAIDS